MSHWINLLKRAGLASVESIGQSPGALVYWIATALLVVVLVWWRGGWAAVRDHLAKKVFQTIGVAVVAWLPIFIWYLGYFERDMEVAVQLQQEQFKESKNSLRRRTMRLADDLDAFRDERWAKRPRPEEEARQYDQATSNLYLSLFKSRTIGIIQELQAKGLDVGLLGAPGAAQSRFLMADETKELRHLAHYLDAKGSVVQF